MKKFYLLPFCAFMSFWSVYAKPKDVIILPTSLPGNTHRDDFPRAPMRTPHVSIEDYTLFFDSVCSECVVQLYQDGIIVFSGSVNENGELLLPSNLNGTYIIKFQLGSTIFVGEIEL